MASAIEDYVPKPRPKPKKQYVKEKQELNINMSGYIEDNVSEKIAERKRKQAVQVAREKKETTQLKIDLKVPPDEETKSLLELNKHRHNIREILLNSNATPIRTHYVGNGYACCFCGAYFPKAADLKTHTITAHNKREKSKYMSNTFLFSFIVKLDITNLQCNLCKTYLDSLESLVSHLNTAHDRSLYTDIKSQIVCFKLDDEELKCIFCALTCNCFRRLLEHMNQHYKNFVCDICDAGFVNHRMLTTHIGSHKLGTFECNLCNKVYNNLSSFKYHERTAHTGSHRHKCFQCGEKFIKLNQKKEHMKEVHGAEFSLVHCQACDRTFPNANALRIHTHRDHLMERRFQCNFCDKKFFTAALLRGHVVIHTLTRDFKCEICGKDFARKKTLVAHMKTHKDKAQFSCSLCNKQFFKEETLSAHMQQHDVTNDKLRCEHCNETFTCVSEMESHFMMVHEDI